MTYTLQNLGTTRQSGEITFAYTTTTWTTRLFAEIIPPRGRLADRAKVERILDDQFRRLDSVFRKLK